MEPTAGLEPATYCTNQGNLCEARLPEDKELTGTSISHCAKVSRS